MLSDSLIDDLIEASHKNSDGCSQHLCHSLRREFKAHAVSLYTYLKPTDRLTLRAQSGFKYTDYDSFELPASSIAGGAVSEQKVVTEFITKSHNKFFQKLLSENRSFGRIHAVPLFVKSGSRSSTHNLEQNTFGVVCIYPDSNENDIDPSVLERLSKRLGSVYRHSVETDKANLRLDVVTTTLNSKDLNSFLHKFLILLSEKWGYEAGSVFISDSRNNTLGMRATTGVKEKTWMIERTYSTLVENKIADSNDVGPTVKCFQQGKMIALTGDSAQVMPNKYVERVLGERKSMIFMPLPEPTDYGTNDDIIGVLRTTNKILIRENIKETCCHGWEDVELLTFAAEMMGVIAHLYKHVDNVTWNFERAIHGITKPIKAAQLRLTDIHKYSAAKDLLPHPHNYNLSDSLSYLNALEWQIAKHTSREEFTKIKREKLLLYGQVISKIEAFIRSQSKSYNVDRLVLHSITESDYKSIPPVYGHEKALQTVFRNLAENAMKYHVDNRKESVCQLTIRSEHDANSVRIIFEDEGFGLDESDVPRIFVEGYRSWNAIRREPTGTGIGLSDSLAIMRQLGGDIELVSRKAPTRFDVILQRWNS